MALGGHRRHPHANKSSHVSQAEHSHLWKYNRPESLGFLKSGPKIFSPPLSHLIFTLISWLPGQEALLF